MEYSNYSQKKETRTEDNWFKRNIWWIAVGIAAFIVAFCNDIA